MTGSVRPFILLFQGRSGSTYVTEALDAHPDVRAGLERFAGLRRSPERQLERIRRFYDGHPDHRAVGFKTKLRDIGDPHALAAELRARRARVIYLARRNLVKQVVSFFNSERLHARTDEWNRYGDDERLGPLEVDVHDVVEALDRIERRHRRLLDYATSLDLPLLVVHYEDLLDDREHFFRTLFGFLGVCDVPVEGRARKATADTLHEAVANHAELRDALRGTPYEEMLDEGPSTG